MTTLTYENVTQEQFTSVINALRSGGATVTGDAGGLNISGQGVTAHANLTIGGFLTVQITQKPFFIPESLIDSQIKKALGRA